MPTLTEDCHFDDKLCMFRCLACQGQKTKPVHIERETNRLWRLWLGYKGLSENQFKGIDIKSDICELQQCFNVNICVFELDQDQVASIVYKSANFYLQTMYLNLFENHVSYIANFSLYSKHYKCISCSKSTANFKALNRHEK